MEKLGAYLIRFAAYVLWESWLFIDEVCCLCAMGNSLVYL